MSFNSEDAGCPPIILHHANLFVGDPDQSHSSEDSDPSEDRAPLKFVFMMSFNSEASESRKPVTLMGIIKSCLLSAWLACRTRPHLR
jgi:hypothetical protein